MAIIFLRSIFLRSIESTNLWRSRLKNQLALYQNRVNEKLTFFLELQKNNDQTLDSFIEAIQYATLNQGKRLRPALLYSVAEALKIDLESLDAAAAALELIHSYSLVHDDLPAMDNDDLRRGLPTAHIKFGEAHAILIGDAQQTLAFEMISGESQLTAEQKIIIIQILASASGPAGMIGGQVLDIESEHQQIDLKRLKQLHLQKTGALIQAALLIGAVPAENFVKIKPQLEQLGKLIGLAFQVHDDILDIEADTATLGKPQGSDELAEKSTYPKLLGLAEAKIYRDELIAKAKLTLKNLEFESEFLQQLIDYIGQRNY